MEWREGFVENLPFEEYAAVDALNGSALVHMRRSPMKYRHERDNPSPATQSMLTGVYIHRMILEPSRVGDFAVWGTLPEEKVRRGQVWESFKELNEGATIITEAERDLIVSISASVRKSKAASKYVRAEGPTELSMFWIDPVSKRKFKGRLDKLIPATHTIADLKQARSSEPFKFGGQAYALGYHIKAAIYCNGYKALTSHEAKFRFIAVEPKPPYEPAVFRATKDAILQGNLDLEAILQTLAACERSNTWPPSQMEETDLTLPPYAYMDADELADLTYSGD